MENAAVCEIFLQNFLSLKKVSALPHVFKVAVGQHQYVLLKSARGSC